MDIFWLIIGIIGVLAIGLAILIIWIRPGSRTPADIQQYLNDIPSPWTDSSPVPGGERNVCSIYTFPTTIVAGQVLAPTPNLTGLNSLTPQFYDGGSCYDPDQSIAAQKIRTCTGSLCFGSDGTRYSSGETEILYDQCPGVVCTGSYGATVFNFNPDTTGVPLCLQSNSDLTVSGLECNLSNPGQLWRIERTNSPTYKPDANGSIARIYSRLEQGCLQPASSNITAGTELRIGPCLTNAGYNWILVPATSFAGGATAPQQIVYFPLWKSGIPSNFQGAYSAVVINGIPQLQQYNITNDVNFNGQLLDLNLYNVLVNIPTSGGYGFPPLGGN